ncbi:MAG: hypothetical protein R3C59_13180 [Planctomycetaceae bacterium]
MKTDPATLLQQFEPQETKSIVADPQVTEARFSPCGCYLAAGGFDAHVRIWDVSGDEPVELPPIIGHNGWVHAIVFHPTDDILYSADSWGQIRATRHDGGELQPIWDCEHAHDGWIRQIDLSPDGSRLASVGADGRVALWNTADGELIREWSGHGCDVQSVRFHPDGQRLVSGDAFGKVKVWDVTAERSDAVRDMDASTLWLLSRLQDVGGVRLLRFSPDGAWLACGGVTPKNGGTVQGKPTLLVFDFASGEVKHTLVLGEEKDCFLHDLHWHVAGFLIGVTSGTPGAGRIEFRRLEDEKPFFESTRYPNCHSVSVPSDQSLMAIVTTNRNSNGNGRKLDKDGNYAGNNSPIQLFRFGKKEA